MKQGTLLAWFLRRPWFLNRPGGLKRCGGVSTLMRSKREARRRLTQMQSRINNTILINMQLTSKCNQGLGI
jgi:hypothetical protein